MAITSQPQKAGYSLTKNEYDFGVNYLRCGNIKFVKKHGGEELAPCICLSDIALSDAMSWGLKRTQTLADGCQYCDFRFRKGAETEISSKTKEIQEIIDIIKAKEAEQGAAPDGNSAALHCRRWALSFASRGIFIFPIDILTL